MANCVSFDGREICRKMGMSYKETPFAQEEMTCEGVAQQTGLPLSAVGKTMAVEVDGRLVLVMLSGADRLDIKKVQAFYRAKKVRLVLPEKVEERVGLPVGAVTPLIASSRKEFEVIADGNLFKNLEINISSGSCFLGLSVATAELIQHLAVKVMPLVRMVK